VIFRKLIVGEGARFVAIHPFTRYGTKQARRTLKGLPFPIRASNRLRRDVSVRPTRRKREVGAFQAN